MEKQCFVISPIGSEGSLTRQRADKVMDMIIRPAVSDFGFIPMRSDEFEGDSITTEFVQALLIAPLAIADLTDYNPNVFYEIGIRHFIGKPLILIIDSYIHPGDLPFDIRDERVIKYDSNTDEGFKICQLKVKKKITELENRELKKPQTTSISKAILSLHEKSNREIQHELTLLMLELHLKLSGQPELIQMQQIIEESGVRGIYPKREQALAIFKEYLIEEQEEIFVIGSSLLGFLSNDEIYKILEKQSKTGNTTLKFLLTHPAVADLRANQERRKKKDIGKEIIQSLEKLAALKIPEENVQLYIGAPTIFAIKTPTKMLLNPYAYRSVAYASPCFIIDTENGQNRLLYDAYAKSHFGVWDEAASVETFHKYANIIDRLNRNLDRYSDTVASILDNV